MLKKNILYFILISIGAFILFPVLAYLINSLLDRDISFEQLKSEFSFDYVLNLLINGDVYVSFFKFTELNPINIGFIGVSVIGYLFIILGNFGPSEKNKFERKENYGSHGTARFQTGNEIRKNYYTGPREGWFLGSINEDSFELGMKSAVHAISNAAELNAQINVVGPPGSNKTTGYVYPNMFYIPYAYEGSEDNPDIIVTDPKGEILSFTGKYLESKNYDLKIIDFLHLMYGDSVNPISYIEEEEDIMKIATGFVGAAGMKNAKSQSADPIWEQGESLLLGALIAFVLEVYPPEKRTFEEVSKVLASPNIRDFDKAETLFTRHNITGYGEELWNKFLNLEDKLRSGVVGGLSIKMALFSLSKVKRITNTNSFDFKEIGRKKEKPLAIFIQMPDEDRTFSPIINTIISMMIKTMYSTARETGSKLPNPVYMILEEIANIGKLPSIEELLGTMRGRRIFPMMIWQDLVQMKSMFGDAWDGIIAKCDTQIYLGVNDQTTAKYVSEKLGKTTIQIQGTSSKDEGILSSGKTQSKSKSQRQLMFPDEVERFDNRKLIVIQRSRNPVVLKKTQYKFWEKMIMEPLELDDLPLVSRFYENNTSQEETIKIRDDKEVAATFDDVHKTEDNSPQMDENFGESVVIETGEIIPEEEIIQFEEPINFADEVEMHDVIEDDEEFTFSFENEPQEEIIQLPGSEFERRN